MYRLNSYRLNSLRLGGILLASLLVLVSAVLLQPIRTSAQDAAQVAAPDQALATTAAPEFLLDGYGSRMSTGGGFLYWQYYKNSPSVVSADLKGETSADGFLQRYPLGGGKDVRLSDIGIEYRGLNADDIGVHYYNPARNGIVLRSLTNPAVETPLVFSAQPDSPIVSDPVTGMMYWIANQTLFYADRDEPSIFDTSDYGDMANAGAGAHDLALSPDGYLYWFGDGRIYRAYKFCTTPGSNCQREIVATANGRELLYHQVSGISVGSGYYLHWILGSTIQAYGCTRNILTGGDICSVSTIYSDAAPQVDINYLAASGNSLFWIETDVQPHNTDAFVPELKRYQFGVLGAEAETIAGGLGEGYTIKISSGLATGNGYVYYFVTKDSSKLARTRVNAPAIQSDIAASGMEVVQAIQRLDNFVPLVAQKPTYVKLYGRLAGGSRRNGIEATLTGVRNGQTIGSLRPVNGVQHISLNSEPDRDQLYDAQTWLFRLPDAWTEAGPLTLQAVINPSKLAGEPNGLNNRWSVDIAFADKSPICAVFIPVRTATPVNMFSAAHWFTIAMAERLLPTPDIAVYTQANDVAELELRAGIPPWEYGPYELAEDGDKIILALWERDRLSDDPDECDAANARTHYVGVINPSEEGLNGKGMRGYDSMLYRLPPDDQLTQDWRAERAPTLAHELGHNYGRKHVDCPVGVPKDVGSYPYPTCQLDADDSPDPFYGLTYNTVTTQYEVILPTRAGDLMSYAHTLVPSKPRWISDVTWRDIMNDLDDRTLRRAAVGDAPLAQASDVVLVSGVIDPDVDANASLGYAWVLPTATVSKRMVEKWEEDVEPTMAALHAAGHTADGYHLRLLDANGVVLDDRLVELIDDPEDADGAQPFALTFPAPTAMAGSVARIELLHGETVITSRAMGGAAPTVTVLQPTGGTSVGENMTIAWRASDSDAQDQLLYTVQYSPDNGATWRAVLTSVYVPAEGDIRSVKLDDLSGLPASMTGALIRVLVSDGYNTTAATSQPFTLANRAPSASILAPQPAQQLAAGELITLQGMAMDAESGSLPESAFTWTVDDAPIGSGRQFDAGQLLPGEHTAVLTVTDAANAGTSVDVSFSVAPLRIPALADPTLDGRCDDDVYQDATALQLQPYTDGSQATVFLQRSVGYLWACFADMQRSPDPSLATRVGVRVDVDHSRDSTLSDGDLLFVMAEDALPLSYVGVLQPGLASFTGQVSSEGTLWSAELRIDAAALGNWQRTVGLALSHSWVYTLGDDLQWPHSAVWDNPSTWATTAMGDLPAITQLSPATAMAGSPGFTLLINGTELAGDSIALWNGDARPTNHIDGTSVQVMIGAADLAAAGVVRVEMAHNNGSTSNPLLFTVTNPQPTITQVNTSGSTVTVDGANFVEGSTIQWDGETVQATFVSAMRLQASVTTKLADLGPQIDVAVYNPSPGGGLSNITTITVDRTANRSIFLPLISR